MRWGYGIAGGEMSNLLSMAGGDGIEEVVSLVPSLHQHLPGCRWEQQCRRCGVWWSTTDLKVQQRLCLRSPSESLPDLLKMQGMGFLVSS